MPDDAVPGALVQGLRTSLAALLELYHGRGFEALASDLPALDALWVDLGNLINSIETGRKSHAA
jgi:hypothetical protein